MFIASPRHTHNLMSEQPNTRYSLPIPMVYENVRVEPANWEYHVLTIDAREETLPDAARLSELGRHRQEFVDPLLLRTPENVGTTTCSINRLSTGSPYPEPCLGDR